MPHARDCDHLSLGCGVVYGILEVGRLMLNVQKGLTVGSDWQASDMDSGSQSLNHSET